MDRYCEFCVNLRSVVYCKADAAYLCLSCDTKVHSANPLSKRHHRTLICESCRRRPAYVRCYHHRKFMCLACDLSQHDVSSSQHRKRVVNGYFGSPSARDLGLLWGFDFNQCASTTTSVVSAETSDQIKEDHGDMQAFSILQQLIDLLKVQTSDVDHIPSMIRCQGHKLEKDDRFLHQLSLEEGPHDHDDMSLDPCSSPFTQLDHLESSEIDETSLHGDSFWQCKSPVPSSQLWSQTLQDLGVCEEPSSLDHLNIPDIDVTFRNFEELFRTEQEPTTIHQDTMMVTSSAIAESSPKKARYASRITSFSHSRLSVESSDTIRIDSGISPSCGSTKLHESAILEGKKNVQLKDSIRGQCDYRKARSGTRKRTKSQIWKFESKESVTKSC